MAENVGRDDADAHVSKHVWMDVVAAFTAVER